MLYGYVEARIKMPYEQGLWPAFWTVTGQNVQNPVGANEMDIFEMLGSDPPYLQKTNFVQEYCTDCRQYDPYICNSWVYNETQCDWEDPGKLWYGADIPIPNYTNFINYGFEWSPDKLIWYMNGKPIRVSENELNFNQRVKLILNLAVADWDNGRPDATTNLPAKMEVAYMRVYEIKNDCNTVISGCSYNYNNHDERVKKKVTIGGGCQTVILSGNDLNLRVTDEVIINNNFEIQSGAELFIDVNDCY